MKRWMDNFKKKIADNPEAAGGELISMEQESEGGSPKKEKQNVLARFRRESKRDRQLAVLTDGYQKLTGLMSSIQMHLESQTQSQQRLLNAMEHLPEVAESLKKVGSEAEKQTEVMGMMREQLNSSVQHDQKLVESMNRFNKTLAMMNTIFLLLLLGGLSVGIYFSLNDSVKESMTQKAKELFAKQPPVAEAVEPIAETTTAEEPVPIVESPAEEPAPPVEPLAEKMTAEEPAPVVDVPVEEPAPAVEPQEDVPVAQPVEAMPAPAVPAGM